MSKVPSDLRYAKTHEWVRLEADEVCTVGITDHAQDALGDIVFVELPDVGEELYAKTEACVLESVKAASDIITPISGTIIQVNNKLIKNPALVNTDPYGDGWLLRIKAANLKEMDDLDDAETYQSELVE